MVWGCLATALVPTHSFRPIHITDFLRQVHICTRMYSATQTPSSSKMWNFLLLYVESNPALISLNSHTFCFIFIYRALPSGSPMSPYRAPRRHRETGEMRVLAVFKSLGFMIILMMKVDEVQGTRFGRWKIFPLNGIGVRGEGIDE